MATLTYSLWFHDRARQAVNTYVELFDEAQLTGETILRETPSGFVDLYTFTLGDLSFSAMSAGPYLTLNDSISVVVHAKNKEEIDRLYKTLSEDGVDRIPLQSYSFNPYYAWVEDKFGLNWQLMLAREETENNSFSVCLLFGNKQNGLAAPAMAFFEEKLGATLNVSNKYTDFPGKAKTAEIAYGSMSFLGKDFTFMDHGTGGPSVFSGAFSFTIGCKDQEEIDHYWNLLSAVPEVENCGWCQDEFGIFWQIVPEKLQEITMTADRETLRKIQTTYAHMTKFIIKDLEQFWG